MDEYVSSLLNPVLTFDETLWRTVQAWSDGVPFVPYHRDQGVEFEFAGRTRRAFESAVAGGLFEGGHNETEDTATSDSDMPTDPDMPSLF